MPNISNNIEYTVSEFSAAVKKNIETNFEYVRIKGEISGLKVATSGHVYFNIKDNYAILACISWKHSLSKFTVKPEDGLEIIATGKITIYPAQSKYQMIVELIEVAGIGALMAQYELLKNKFITEGLFDNSKKKKVPYLPQSIGIITSTSGVVIQDIIHRIRDRCGVRLIIWPVTVQGQSAAEEVSKAIIGFNNYIENNLPKVDVIIIARGGGSIEDLWSFNQEIVIRTAAESHIPLISAIGHETDFTLLDFVADLRAPTPTAAAEFAVPVLDILKKNLLQCRYLLSKNITDFFMYQVQKLDNIWIRFIDNFNKKIVSKEYKFKLASNSIMQPERQIKLKALSVAYILNNINRLILDKIKIKTYNLDYKLKFFNIVKLINLQVKAKNTLDIWNSKLNDEISVKFSTCKNRLTSTSKMLESLNYKQVLKRGYAITRSIENRSIINNSKEIGSSFTLEFYDDEINIKRI